MSIYGTLNQLILQSKKASPDQLAQLTEQAGVAPFAGDLLEADEALWGSFWQGDVIAPGYLLPAAELALLRATRLDGTWPEETSVAEFLADLHGAIRHPQAGVWALRAAGEPCLIFAAPRVEGLTFNVEGSTLNVATLVWYCATTGRLHAGYRALLDRLHFAGTVELRAPETQPVPPPEPVEPPTWLEHGKVVSEASLVARLEAEILKLRRKARPDGF